MNPKLSLALALASLLAGCGGSEQPTGGAAKAQPAAAQKTPERRETVFDPWVGTIDRAKAVQNTVDDQAAEQRRKIEEATR
jgi:ABC-type glycerol-3-phosphate transport system substrate-binding protein